MLDAGPGWSAGATRGPLPEAGRLAPAIGDEAEDPQPAAIPAPGTEEPGPPPGLVLASSTGTWAEGASAPEPPPPARDPAGILPLVVPEAPPAQGAPGAADGDEGAAADGTQLLPEDVVRILALAGPGPAPGEPAESAGREAPPPGPMPVDADLLAAWLAASFAASDEGGAVWPAPIPAAPPADWA